MTRAARRFSHPKVLLLAAAYFFIVTGNYGVEFFLPSILKKWYNLDLNKLTWLVIIPPIGSLVGQLFVGWSSDRTQRAAAARGAADLPGGRRRWLCTLLSRDQLWLTIALFTVALTGLKAYLPAFWSLPSLFLTEAAAAGSIGLINSVGNLGGFLGPSVLGTVEKLTGSFQGGIALPGHLDGHLGHDPPDPRPRPPRRETPGPSRDRSTKPTR